MKIQPASQLVFLLAALVAGGVLGLVYDLLRALRYGRDRPITAVTDGLFVFAFSGAFFLLYMAGGDIFWTFAMLGAGFFAYMGSTRGTVAVFVIQKRVKMEKITAEYVKKLRIMKKMSSQIKKDDLLLKGKKNEQ